METAVDHIVLELTRDLERGAALPKRLETLATACPDKRIAEALRDAARNIKNGESPDQALRRHNALPEAYLVALSAKSPKTIEVVADAVRNRRSFVVHLRTNALRCLAMLSAVMIGLVVGVHTALPVIERTMQEALIQGGDLWRASVVALKWFAGPIGLALLLSAFAIAFSRPHWVLGMRRHKLLAPVRASICRALAAFLRADVSLERAIPLAGSIGGDRQLKQNLAVAGKRVAGGHSAGDALSPTGLCDDFADLWRAGTNSTTLATIGEGLADVFDVRSNIQKGLIADRSRAVYAIIGGILVAWASITLIAGYLEIVTWLASS